MNPPEPGPSRTRLFSWSFLPPMRLLAALIHATPGTRGAPVACGADLLIVLNLWVLPKATRSRGNLNQDADSWAAQPHSTSSYLALT